MEHPFGQIFETMRNARQSEATLLEEFMRETILDCPIEEREALYDAICDELIGWAQFLKQRGEAESKPEPAGVVAVVDEDLVLKKRIALDLGDALDECDVPPSKFDGTDCETFAAHVLTLIQTKSRENHPRH